jgi:predicted phosphoribosyltransferase
MAEARHWFLRFLAGRTDDPDEVMFPNRREAGRRLALALKSVKEERPVVLALPRGGVPVAFEVATALRAPLDVILVRKIGAPGHPELGLGAIVEGNAPNAPQVLLNDELVRMVKPDPAYLEAEKARQMAEIERQRRLYRRGRPLVDIEGRTVIVIDDGIATGGTVKAVLRAIAAARPARRILAVPVAPEDSLAQLAPEADRIVCLATPDPFFAVGAHYHDFSQTTDEEVVELLHRAARVLEEAPAHDVSSSDSAERA